MTLYLDRLGVDYEILLRDDGSTDGTRALLEKMPNADGRVRCFFNTSNRGLGFTLRTLFQEAQGENVIYCDCDLPFGEGIIGGLLDELKSCDVAVASRYQGNTPHVSLMRRLVSRLYYHFCRFLFQIPVVDIGSGTVALRRQALERLDLKINGFGIHAELYVKAAGAGLAIREAAAEAADEGLNSFRIGKHGLSVILETLWLWYALNVSRGKVISERGISG